MTAAALRTLAVAPAPAPAQASKPAPQGQATAAHPFAELLRQNRAAATTPAARETTRPQAQESDAARAQAEAPTPPESTGQNESTGTRPATPQRDARQAKARSAGATRAAASETTSEARQSDATPDAATASASDDKNAASPAPDASLVAGAAVNAGPALAASTQAATVDADSAAATTRGKGSAAIDIGRLGVPAAGGPGPAPLGDGTQPGQSARPAVGDPADDRGVVANDKNDVAAAGDARDTAAPASPSFAGMLAESKASHGTAPLVHTNNDAATATPQNAGLVAGTTPGNTGAASATLPVAVHAPEFAAAFGVQVSVLAKDGVQHAELHLNPAEMGPVSIQITLDGTQARVDFGADVAATRHAIEAGLPELASALRDAGFTLAGGGVAQHSASNGGGSGGDAEGGRAAATRSGAASSTELDATATRLTRRVADGGVDLYA
jgi:flagellar hook-length control protein FliK